MEPAATDGKLELELVVHFHTLAAPHLDLESQPLQITLNTFMVKLCLFTHSTIAHHSDKRVILTRLVTDAAVIWEELFGFRP